MMVIVLSCILTALLIVCAWRFPRLRREIVIAGGLTAPILALPLLAGNGFYPGFWWNLLFVISVGALVDVIYYRTLRRLLTPAIHPHRIRLRWLIVGPFIALSLFWFGQFSLIAGAAIALALGIVASFIIGRSLIWDALASSIGFGLLYVALFLSLNIPIVGHIETISRFSGIIFLTQPIEELALVFFFGALWGPLCAVFRRLPEEAEARTFEPHRNLLGKQIMVVIFVILAGIGGYWIQAHFIALPVLAEAASGQHNTISNLSSPLTFHFDKPIDRQKIHLVVTPPIEGDISFSNSYIERNFVREMNFTPSTHFDPGTSYTIQIEHVSNVLGRTEKNYTVTFTAPALPTVSTISVSDGQKDVNICDPFTVKTDQAAGTVAEFSFELTPAIPMKSTVDTAGTTYTITPTTCLAQSTSYSLVVKRQLTVFSSTGTLLNSDEQPVPVKTVSFTTKGAPGIATFAPQGVGITAATNHLTIGFTEPMAQTDPTSFLAIQPPIPGSWKWSDERTLTYTATNPLTLDTKYIVTVMHGMKDAHDGFLSQDAAYSFTTLGHVQIIGVSPRSGSGGVSVTAPLKITFDQPVDHASAEQRFSLSPASDGSFSWSGQTLIYSTTLQKDTTYRVSVDTGVVSLIGLPSSAGVSVSFTTEQSVFVLNIPVYYQQKPLSCEAASLKMALNFKGVAIGEDTILNAIGTDLTPRNGNVWGDPYQAFVGDVNGVQNTTGYGVYSPPVAAVASQYRTAQAVSGMSASYIATTVSQGNPVIFWGISGGKADPWVTPAGREISNGWIGEHVRLVIGFTGRATNPTGFIINDPIFGRLHWTTGQLLSNMSVFGGMGVAIF